MKEYDDSLDSGDSIKLMWCSACTDSLRKSVDTLSFAWTDAEQNTDNLNGQKCGRVKRNIKVKAPKINGSLGESLSLPRPRDWWYLRSFYLDLSGANVPSCHLGNIRHFHELKFGVVQAISRS